VSAVRRTPRQSTTVFALAGALATVPLPPPLTPLDGVAADPDGSSTLRAYGSVSDSPVSGGAGLNLTHQFAADWSGNVTAGSTGKGDFADSVLRLGQRYSFLDDHLAFTLGVTGELLSQCSGACTTWTQDPSVIVDAGIRGGGLIANVFEPYAGISAAGGFPIWRGGEYDLFPVASVGFNFRFGEHWRLGFDVTGPLAEFVFGPHQRASVPLPALLTETISFGYLFADPAPPVVPTKWQD
jgi:hypothetical protein